MPRSEREQIDLLAQYSACDVSDALLKLEKQEVGEIARAGYLADLIQFTPPPGSQSGVDKLPKVIARASTLKLIDKSDPIQFLASHDPHAIPKDSHWADETEEDTILVIEQPAHQTCAAVGGIMAARMKFRGLRGCVVGGRVRDLAELRRSNLPIWALGKSTVGAGAESKVFARNVPVVINKVVVSPGDIVFCDPLEGVVVVPVSLVDDVIDLIPRLVAADDKVKDDVEGGSTVYVAFQKHRS